MKPILILAYVFFLALYALGPIVLLLKRQADAAGGKKKLWKTYLALFGAGALATGAAYGIERALTALLSPDPETGFGCFINAFIVAGMTEETVKFIALMLFIPNLTCTLNIFVRVLCYDLISFGFSCPYHTDCIS